MGFLGNPFKFPFIGSSVSDCSQGIGICHFQQHLFLEQPFGLLPNQRYAMPEEHHSRHGHTKVEDDCTFEGDVHCEQHHLGKDGEEQKPHGQKKRAEPGVALEVLNEKTCEETEQKECQCQSADQQKISILGDSENLQHSSENVGKDENQADSAEVADSPMYGVGVINIVDQKVGKQVESEKAEVDQQGRIAEEEEFAGRLAEHPTAKHEQHQAEVEEALALILGLDREGEYEDQRSQQQEGKSKEEGWPLLELGEQERSLASCQHWPYVA